MRASLNPVFPICYNSAYYMNSPWECCTQFSIWFNTTYKNQGKGDARCTLLYKTFVFEATFRWEHILAYERAINLEWRSQLWSGPRSNSSRELVSSFNAVFIDLHNHATVVSVSRRKSLYRTMLRRMGGRDAEVVPKRSPILFFSFSVCVWVPICIHPTMAFLPAVSQDWAILSFLQAPYYQP